MLVRLASDYAGSRPEITDSQLSVFWDPGVSFSDKGTFLRDGLPQDILVGGQVHMAHSPILGNFPRPMQPCWDRAPCGGEVVKEAS